MVTNHGANPLNTGQLAGWDCRRGSAKLVCMMKIKTNAALLAASGVVLSLTAPLTATAATAGAPRPPGLGDV